MVRDWWCLCLLCWVERASYGPCCAPWCSSLSIRAICYCSLCAMVFMVSNGACFFLLGMVVQWFI